MFPGKFVTFVRPCHACFAPGQAMRVAYGSSGHGFGQKTPKFVSAARPRMLCLLLGARWVVRELLAALDARRCARTPLGKQSVSWKSVFRGYPD